MTTSSVTVRMYDVGFGDAFLITAKQNELAWRMLVDCGVHNQGRDRPLRDVVQAIVSDLAGMAKPSEPPMLDVVVATHHHADHIAGFAYEDWEKVQVGEVWVSFVENEDDEDTRRLKNGLAQAAESLKTQIDSVSSPDGDPPTEKIAVAGALAENSLRNEDAMDRLLGRNGKHFLNSPRVRYLPDEFPQLNVIRTSLPDVLVHVLGPSRDPAQLKRMNPPKSAQWLTMSTGNVSERSGDEIRFEPIFDGIYCVTAEEFRIAAKLDKNDTSIEDFVRGLPSTFEEKTNALLAAASVLERSVNNTSLFFVVDVDGVRLVFVGDSQRGAWEHVLEDERARELIRDPAFYKIGHHGSHNATPKEYVADLIGDNANYAMLPYGKVKQWVHIPKPSLLNELKEMNTFVIKSDDPPIGNPLVRVGPDNIWSEISLTSM